MSQEITPSGIIVVTGPLTDAELRATPVPVSGTVTANAGSGTLAVSGPLTDAQLRATAVPVEQATSVDIADGGGSITVDGPVTDAQLRASPVPVEQATSVDIADGGGSITVDGPVTDAQLRATPVPVEQATSVDVADGGGSLTVDGTVTADTELPAAAALADNTANPTVPAAGAFGMVYDGATWDRETQPLTDTQLRATPVSVEQATSVDVADGGGSLTVDGTVTANAGTGPFPVSDNGGSLTVDGSVAADTELPTAAALADNTANPTVPGVGAFGMVWDGATWDRAVPGLTDTQLRATPVPVSGTVTANAGTGPFPVSDNGGTLSVDDGAGSLTVDGTVTANAGTGPFPVSDNGGSLTVDGTATTTHAADTTATGLMDALDEVVTITVPPGAQQVGVLFTGTIGANSVLTMEGSVNGTTWDALSVMQTSGVNVPGTTITGTAIAFGANNYLVSAAGLTQVRCRLSTFTAADSVTGTLRAGVGSAATYVMGGVTIGGDIAHDTPNSTSVVQVGASATPADVPNTLVTLGDRTRFWADRAGAQVVRPRKIRESYTAVFRLAEAAARLDQTFTHVANTTKQWATLHHTAAATKELRLLKVVVWVTSAATVAPQGIIELRELSSATPPATGNPAITPRPHRIGASASEAVALYLPTTQGSEAAANAPLAHFVTDDAVSVATAAFVHPQDGSNRGITLYEAGDEPDEVMPPTAVIGTYGGWAVATRFVGATAARLTVMMKFVEEIV